MTKRLSDSAVVGLRWVLGLVVLMESLHFAISPAVGRHFTDTRLPGWWRWVLGGAEIVAVVLFLLPTARILGGYLLLAVFALAVILHLSLGEFDVGNLIVYGMAVIVWFGFGRRQNVGGAT
jgi:hypothetical protein